jgi:hypothetical protein
VAHPRAVAVRRQIADKRLHAATEVAARKFGVPFKVPVTLAQRHPDLYSAELIENVSQFLETISAEQAERKTA